MVEFEENSVQPILIVEDSDEDFFTTQRAFKKANLKNPVFRCSSGDEALDFLYKRGDYASYDDTKPGIILLDLNLPGTDGRDVLEEVKKNDEFKTIPIVILTTSSDERDINKCYECGANSYVQKPVDLDSFMDAIKRLKDYWFEVVIVPKKE